MLAHLALLLALAVLVGFTDAAASVNAWGWAYDNGAPLSRERRVNIISQMLLTGGNVAATAMFVKCCHTTVRKWWRRWVATGDVDVLRTKRGPAPVLGAAALLYLLCLSELNRQWTLAQYQENLSSMIGVLASERVICAALKRLGQHRKATSVKKVEGVGSRTPGGSAYHTYIVLFFVTSRGTGHRQALTTVV